MHAGELRDRITLLTKTSSTDAQGGLLVTWAPLTTAATVWASVRPATAAERVQDTTVSAAVAYQVSIRYRSDVTPTMRCTWRPYRATADVTLEVHGVTPLDGDREFLVLACGVVV